MTTAAITDGIREVTPAQALRLLRSYVKAKQPVMMWGPPGIGKSAIVKQIAKELERPLIDYRLILRDPTDIRGIPFVANGEFQMSIPSDLPRPGRLRNGMDENRAVLFLDEINSAPASTQAAAYQLVLDRRIGEYQLPDDAVMIAAGNRVTDKGVAYPMPAPLADRFAHISVVPSFKDWTSWAARNGIRSEIVGYLTNAQHHWNTFDPTKSKCPVFATPRSWEMVSNLIDDDLSNEDNMSLVASLVGDGIALAFMQYRELTVNIPSARDILAGETPSVDNIGVNVLYTLVYNIAYALKDIFTEYGFTSKEYSEAYDNYLKYSSTHLPKELTVLSIRLMRSEFNLMPNIPKLKNLREWMAKFSRYIVE